MKIGQPKWPGLDEPVAVEYDGWYAVWEGGEYINVYPADPNQNPDVTAIHSINTTGDEFDPEDPDGYVRSELKTWADEDGAVYAANML